MPRCAIELSAESYHDHRARRERAAERIEADTRAELGVDDVLGEIFAEDYLREIVAAHNNQRIDNAAFGAAVRAVLKRAEDKAVAAIVDRALGREGF